MLAASSRPSGRTWPDVGPRFAGSDGFFHASVSLRLGRDGLLALEEIARRRGVSRSEAARQAIAEAAEREQRRAGLAAEARMLMKDEAYVREAQEVAELMEQMRGPR
jgi:predicted transcriptional regulator